MMLEKDAYKNISDKIINNYYSHMKKYLLNYQGKITEAEALVLIFNISLTVGTNIYYSLRDFLPTASFNHDLMTKHFLERMKDALLAFENIDNKEAETIQ